MKIFKKFTLLSLLTISFSSCSQSGADSFIGAWSNKKVEIYVMEISKSGDNYVLTYGSRKKFIGTLEDGILSFDNGKKAIVSEDGNVIYDNKDWIPFDQTTVTKYEGTWKDSTCLGCSTINISFDKKTQRFSVSYPNDSYYMLDVEQTDNLQFDVVEYNTRDNVFSISEVYKLSDFGINQRYRIKLSLSPDGQKLNYECSDNDNPIPFRVYTKQ